MSKTAQNIEKKSIKARTLKVGDMTITPEPRNRYVTLEIGGKKTRVHYKELWGAVFMLGDGEYRAQMIPDKKEERLLFSRKLQIQTKRPLKAGEVLTVWVEFDVAKDVVESIAEKNGAKVLEQSPLSTPKPNSLVESGGTM